MTTIVLQQWLAPPWRHRTKTSLHIQHTPAAAVFCVALSKQGHRLFTSIATTDDVSSTTRLIRKFVASSSKFEALDAITHLVSPNNTSFRHLSPLAFPLYSMISKAPWFNWNPKLVADVIASLYKHERFDEAETLILEAVSQLGSRERDLCNFYCNLMDSHSKHQSKRGINDSCERMNQLLSHSSSIYLKKRYYESIIGSLSVIDLPHEAESLIKEMKNNGLIKPSIFQYRSVIYAYGRIGFFEDMKRVICLMESDGYEVDVVCSNMVLSSLGAHNELLQMVSWLQRMKKSNITFSIRTYNSVLNHCPTIMSMVQHPKGVIPKSLKELLENLSGDEALVVQELVDPSVLAVSMELTSSEMKLDLHGMHLGSAYLIILQWFHELMVRYSTGNQDIPCEVTVVCGAGKHSSVRGESPVKRLVKEMMVQMRSPLRIDRKNVGCFVAKGRVLMDSLFQIENLAPSTKG